MPDIAILTGIAWDHINVFPTFDNYISQFEIFIDLIDKDGALIYCNTDEELTKLANKTAPKLKKLDYGIPKHIINENGISHITENGDDVALKIFGDHNLMNLNGARLVCEQIGISKNQFYDAIKNFNGASNRLELIAENKNTKVWI